VNIDLISCQQISDVPKIQLAFLPEIKEAVLKAKEADKHASAEDLGEKLKDANFVNDVVNLVVSWI